MKEELLKYIEMLETRANQHHSDNEHGEAGVLYRIISEIDGIINNDKV